MPSIPASFPTASCCPSRSSSARARAAGLLRRAPPARMSDPAVKPASREDLEALARRGRLLVLESVANAGAGHIGGPLSAMDVLVGLFFGVLRIRPDEPG